MLSVWSPQNKWDHFSSLVWFSGTFCFSSMNVQILSSFYVSEGIHLSLVLKDPSVGLKWQYDFLIQHWRFCSTVFSLMLLCTWNLLVIFFIFYLKGRDKDLVTGSLPSVHSSWDWPRPVRNQELIHDISLGWQGPKYLASHLSPCKVYIERKLSLRVESELQLGWFGGRCQQHLIHGCLMPVLAGTFISLDKLVFCLLLIRFSFRHKFWIIGLWDFSSCTFVCFCA